MIICSYYNLLNEIIVSLNFLGYKVMSTAYNKIVHKNTKWVD
jgi:hypothetical protein